MQPTVVDPFAAIGVPSRLKQDDADLERRFYARSRELHPDRADGADRAAVEAEAAALNDAYRAIKDLPSRARAWLALRGASLDAARGGGPSALALRGFEVQEAAEAARGGDAAARARLEELASEVDRDRTDAARRLAALADSEPAGPLGPTDPFTARVLGVVVESNYLARQTAQIAEVLEDA